MLVVGWVSRGLPRPLKEKLGMPKVFRISSLAAYQNASTARENPPIFRPNRKSFDTNNLAWIIVLLQHPAGIASGRLYSNPSVQESLLNC